MIKYKVGTLPIDGSCTPICHCISADRVMAAGFAAIVPDEHKRQVRLHEIRLVGSFYYSSDAGQEIVHLVTKDKVNEKPTMESFALAIHMLEYHAKKNGATQFHCPMMGAGIDRLPWEDVERILDSSPIEFTVWVLPDHPFAIQVHAIHAQNP